MSNADQDNSQYDPSELPEGWQQNIKKKDYKADDYKVNKSYKDKKLVDQKRKCTDVCCCLLFLAVTIAMFGFAGYGYVNGEVRTLLAPVDSRKKLCGFGDEKNYPHLLIDFDKAVNTPTTNMFIYGACVEKCPKDADTPVKCAPDSNVPNCFTKKGMQQYATIETMNYCLPNLSKLSEKQKAQAKDLMSNFSTGFMGSYAADMYKARWVIVASVGVCLVITLIYITVMRCCAEILAWLSIIFIQLGFIALGFFFWYSWQKGEDELSTTGLFWGMIGSWIAAALFYCYLCCNCKSLSVSIAIIKTTSDWVADTKRLFFMPMIFFVIGMIVFAIWLVGFACVASMSDAAITGKNSANQSKNLEWSQQTYYMLYSMVFFLVWMTFFIISFNDYVTIVAAITWYFSDKTIKDDDGIPGDSEVSLGFKWGLQYQLGSIAAGSLILAVVWIIHTILNYIAKKMEAASGENCCVKCIICCCMCIVDCFDRFIRYITQNAFIYMALSNQSFCQSSIHAFLLMLRNSAKFSMVSGISSNFMFIAKVCISVSTTWIGFLLMKQIEVEGERISEPLVPAALILFVSYIIASIFIGVFDAGSNTILQCYLMDKEMGGTDDEPHVPESLRKFLDDDDDKKEEIEIPNAQVNDMN